MESIAHIWQKIEEKRDLIELAEFESVLREGLASCLQELAQKVEFEVATVYAYWKRKDRLQRLADFGGGINFIERIRFDSGYGLSAWVAKKQRPIYLPDIHRGSRHGHLPIRSYLSIPVLIEDELAGVVNFAHTKPHAFERQEMIMVKSFAESLKSIFVLYQRHHSGRRDEEKSIAR